MTLNTINSSCIPVEYRCNYDRQTSLGTLENINLKGAFLRTSLPFDSTTEKILLTISLNKRKREIKANIVDRGKSGCAVEFLYVGKKGLQLIDDLIYFIEKITDKKKSLLHSIFEKAC